MDGPQQPTRWRTMGALGARWRMPMPPGPPPEPSKALREHEREEEARAGARWGWLHLPSLLSVGGIVMSVALAAVIVLVVLALSHR
jgi:hypothetical protein